MDEDEKITSIVGRTPSGLMLERDDGTTGELRKLREGDVIPPGSELVSVSHEEHDAGEPCRLKLRTICRVGPSRHTTTAYRTGWDRTFGKEAN